VAAGWQAAKDMSNAAISVVNKIILRILPFSLLLVGHISFTSSGIQMDEYIFLSWYLLSPIFPGMFLSDIEN
jgi:hypothetical protein